jgi:hypothetical protein
MCLPCIVTKLTPIWEHPPSGVLTLVYTPELRKTAETLARQFLYLATENYSERFHLWLVPNTVSSSCPLYPLPSGVQSPHNLLYSGNPPPSPAFPLRLPVCDRRLEPIPAPPCSSRVRRPTLCEALFGGCVSYLGIDSLSRVPLSNVECGMRCNIRRFSRGEGAHEKLRCPEDRWVCCVQGDSRSI